MNKSYPLNGGIFFWKPENTDYQIALIPRSLNLENPFDMIFQVKNEKHESLLTVRSFYDKNKINIEVGRTHYATGGLADTIRERHIAEIIAYYSNAQKFFPLEKSIILLKISIDSKAEPLIFDIEFPRLSNHDNFIKKIQATVGESKESITYDLSDSGAKKFMDQIRSDLDNWIWELSIQLRYFMKSTGKTI